ncbi:MAG: 3-oxoacyl-ACP synthase [Winogradskyella sp.]|uniref:3-oxoacyl-ACP synthase n=1 Tax=Winogradskyella sp. TaxID=1883156 RepID=UPI000F3F70C2|nr:3-oxoacyl-ACP synthase [Winogradskyella sp.]RNC88108.1 MAG: 3-oxoacyl-ACP synthase [Winogradskyella sp.]
MELKNQLYNQCQDILNQRLKVIQKTIANVQNALQSETKSTAGDKHETGRAMLQLEREKAGQQLAELQKQIELLQRINPKTTNDVVALGSVVKTTNGNYFIAISAGEIKFKDESFYAISLATPIGKLLISKKVNDTISFRGQTFKIEQVL